jgi:hypothetical protein
MTTAGHEGETGARGLAPLESSDARFKSFTLEWLPHSGATVVTDIQRGRARRC